jgi:hypothetical protein
MTFEPWLLDYRYFLCNDTIQDVLLLPILIVDQSPNQSIE